MNIRERWGWLRDVPVGGADAMLLRAGPVYVWPGKPDEVHLHRRGASGNKTTPGSVPFYEGNHRVAPLKRQPQEAL